MGPEVTGTFNVLIAALFLMVFGAAVGFGIWKFIEWRKNRKKE